MVDSIIEIQEMNKNFLGIRALQNVNFSCSPGEIHAIVGENGAGKSTLLKIISGNLQPDKGVMIINGSKVSFKNPEDARKVGIVMVHQELSIIPELTVSQNIFLNNEYKKGFFFINENKNRQEVVRLLNDFGMIINPDELVKNLSIDRRQMVEILKAYVKKPKILILDEATSTLSKKEEEILFKIINKLQSSGITVIFTSHRLEEIFKIANRATILKDGNYVATVKISEIDNDKLINLMVGRPLKLIFPPKPIKNNGKIVFEVVDLNLGNQLNNISFDVKEGEILCFAGLQGHGQSKLLECLAGISKADNGKIFVHGKQNLLKNPAQAIKEGIAFVPPDRKVQGLLLTRSIRENLTLSCLKILKKFGFINNHKEDLLIKKNIDLLSIKLKNSEQIVNYLSGGNQQKVVLGKTISIKPKVLILNEPTRGIDIETKKEFYSLIRHFADNKVTIIMYSSDLLEVVGISDRVLVMYEGRITANINREDISEENIMRNALVNSNDLDKIRRQIN